MFVLRNGAIEAQTENRIGTVALTIEGLAVSVSKSDEVYYVVRSPQLQGLHSTVISFHK